MLAFVVVAVVTFLPIDIAEDIAAELAGVFQNLFFHIQRMFLSSGGRGEAADEGVIILIDFRFEFFKRKVMFLKK